MCRLMALDTDLRFIYSSQEENEQRNMERVIAVNKYVSVNKILK
jgi:hypothetical protein